MERRNRRLQYCWFSLTPMLRLAPVMRAIALLMFIRDFVGVGSEREI